MTKEVDSKNVSYFFRGRLTSLRSLVPEDYSRIAKWINDPDFNRNLYQGWKPVDAEAIREQFETERRLEDAIQFASCMNSSDELLGWCGFYKWEKIAHSAEIRSFVGTESWGKGYGTEQFAILLKLGFERYNLNRISFGTYHENIGALKIYEKFQVEREGILRQVGYRNGKYYDAHMYGVLRKEYEEKIRDICNSYLS